jgi:hypothetical protein
LKAVLLDDADDAPRAGEEAGLAKLLRDDVDLGIGFKEAVTDDLANEFVGADVVAFGTWLVALESCASMFTIEFEQLKISLLAEMELLGGLDGTKPFALALNEHGQARDDEVIRQHGDLSGGADDALSRDVELHGLVLREKAGVRAARLRIGTLGGYHRGKGALGVMAIR